MSVMLRTEAILQYQKNSWLVISCQWVVSFHSAAPDTITFRILEPFPPEDTALDYSTVQYSIIWANDL